MNATRKRRIIRIALLSLAAVLLLQNLPARISFQAFRFRASAESPEGIALNGFDRLEVSSATLYFEEATRQDFDGEISLLIPADTTITLTAAGRPQLNEERGRVELRPDSMEVRGNRGIRFYYRNTPVATTRRLTTAQSENGTRLRVFGRFHAISALAHFRRLLHDPDNPQQLTPPAEGDINLAGLVKSNHVFRFDEELHFQSDSEHGHIQATDLTYEHGRFTAGNVDVNIRLAATAQYRNVALHDLSGGRLAFRGELFSSDGKTSIHYTNKIAFATAAARYRDDQSTGSLDNLVLHGQGVLHHAEDGIVSRRDTRLGLSGRIHDILYTDTRNDIRVPLLDFTRADFAVLFDDQEQAVPIAEFTTNQVRLTEADAYPALTLRASDTFVIEEIDWKYEEDRPQLRIDGGEIILEPFTLHTTENLAEIHATNLSLSVGAEALEYTDKRDDRHITARDARVTISGGTASLSGGQVHLLETSLSTSISDEYFLSLLNDIADFYAEDLRNARLDIVTGIELEDFRNILIDRFEVITANSLSARAHGRVRAIIGPARGSRDFVVDAELSLNLPSDTTIQNAKFVILIHPQDLRIEGFRGDWNTAAFKALLQASRWWISPTGTSDIEVEQQVSRLLGDTDEGSIADMFIHHAALYSEDDENRLSLTISGHFP